MFVRAGVEDLVSDAGLVTLLVPVDLEVPVASRVFELPVLLLTEVLSVDLRVVVSVAPVDLRVALVLAADDLVAVPEVAAVLLALAGTTAELLVEPVERVAVERVVVERVAVYNLSPSLLVSGFA